MPWKSRLGQDGGQLGAQELQALPHRDAALQQEGADLIDDASALTDQSPAHAVWRLQIELVDGLGRDELHRRALHRFRDRFRIAIVIVLTFRQGRFLLPMKSSPYRSSVF